MNLDNSSGSERGGHFAVLQVGEGDAKDEHSSCVAVRKVQPLRYLHAPTSVSSYCRRQATRSSISELDVLEGCNTISGRWGREIKVE